MTPETSAYDDLAAAAEMQADCLAAGRRLRLERAARAATRPAPSLHFADQPAEQPKRTIEISEATARLAGALHFPPGVNSRAARNERAGVVNED